MAIIDLMTPQEQLGEMKTINYMEHVRMVAIIIQTEVKR